MSKPEIIITGKDASNPEFAEFYKKYAGPTIETPDLMGISHKHRAYIKCFDGHAPLLLITQPKEGEEADEVIGILWLFTPDAFKTEALVQ